jgi:hypothetical protein
VAVSQVAVRPQLGRLFHAIQFRDRHQDGDLALAGTGRHGGGCRYRYRAASSSGPWSTSCSGCARRYH